MVLTVTSEPKPKERVIGEPETSVYGVWYRTTAVRFL
jgi:hypothetical protein